MDNKGYVDGKLLRLWKIKIMKALKEYYGSNNMGKDKKIVGRALREACRQELLREVVRRDQDVYCHIMDILINEEKALMRHYLRKNKKFEAMEYANNVIRVLEKAHQLIIPKYQKELMVAYWELAELHHQLHYVSYAEKYAEIAHNIAKRIDDRDSARDIQ